MNLLLICLEKSLVYSQNRQLRLEEFIYLGSEWEGNGLRHTPKQIKIESKRLSHCRINHSARARINHRSLALARAAMLSQVPASYEVHRIAFTSSVSCRHFMALGSAKTKMKLWRRCDRRDAETRKIKFNYRPVRSAVRRRKKASTACTNVSIHALE